MLFFLVSLLGLTSCRKDDPEYQAAKDREKILKYIRDKDLDAQETENGVFYVIEVEGSGAHPGKNAEVVMTYKGYLLNGKVFDSRIAQELYLPGTIMGFQEGIPKFKRGGKGMLLIPSGMGYGPYPQHTIPANSVLIFDIELIEFRNL